jgi:hypothetical protein
LTFVGTLFLELSRGILNVRLCGQALHHLKSGRHRILAGLWTSHLRL